jgi:hypothetical protein
MDFIELVSSYPQKTLEDACSVLDFLQLNFEEQFKNLISLVEPGGMLWLTYPKLTSKLKTDISRDSINLFAQQNGWTGIAMISIDDNWSALRLKPVDK